MSNKVSRNTTVNRSLLDEAKSLDIRLSGAFENALSIAVSESGEMQHIDDRFKLYLQANKNEK